VFVLDMGEPVRIMDLAVRMIELSGLQVKSAAQPWGQVEIRVTGLRPGEKLYEELLIGDDPQATPHPRIWRAREARIGHDALMALLDRFDQTLLANDVPALRALLQQAVQGYQPTGDVVDWLHSNPGPA
jgi:FlaA1/EpsC-like NDP-sugar epimerase